MSQKFKAGQIVTPKGGGSKYRIVGYKSIGYKSLVLEGVLTNVIFDAEEGNYVEFTPEFEVGKTYAPNPDFASYSPGDPLFVAAIVGRMVYTISPPPGTVGTAGASYKVWTITQGWAPKYTEVTD